MTAARPIGVRVLYWIRDRRDRHGQYTGWGRPSDAPEQNDPNAEYPWIARLTAIGGTTDDNMQQYQAPLAQQAGMERQESELNLGGGSAADPDSGAIRRASSEGDTIIPEEDQAIIDDFTTAARGARNIRQHAKDLSSFSAWLQTQPVVRTLAGLLDAADSPDNPNGLTARTNAFALRGARINAALAGRWCMDPLSTVWR
ncbi:hypothetical protein ACVILI_006918 [Mesorhizobium sp. USDA 4775]